MASEKTEQATPKKLRDARQRGEVARSRDLASAAIFLAVGGAFVAAGASSLQSLRVATLTSIRAVGRLEHEGVLEVVARLGVDAAFPFVIAALLAGTLASFLQVGAMLTFKPLEPKLERLDPVKGLKNLFSQKQLVELLKTMLKIGIVGFVVWQVLRDGVRGIASLAGRDASSTLSVAGTLVTSLLFRVGGAMLAIAVVDVLYQRWRFRQDQKMTKDEVKREYKESEGDPHAKQQRERMHREIIEHDTVERVRTADVLVVNPTHVAVALRYDEEEHDAPEVVARGQEHLARRMIRAAHEAGIPVMRDVPLARSLFALEVGETIPEPLFEAVAAVLKAAWEESGQR